MKVKDINNQALEIIKTVFKAVVVSDDKNVWIKAINFITGKIDSLKLERNKEVINDLDNSGNSVLEVWKWEAVRKQILKKYGKKFICKNTQKK